MMKQQSLTESAAIKLASALNQDGIACRFDPRATRDWLAKVMVPGHVRVCIFANGNGRVTIKTHELTVKSQESKILANWNIVTAAIAQITLAKEPQLALGF
jgi:ABC-type uncharacterized transport system ATPase subunit